MTARESKEWRLGLARGNVCMREEKKNQQRRTERERYRTRKPGKKEGNFGPRKKKRSRESPRVERRLSLEGKNQNQKHFSAKLHPNGLVFGTVRDYFHKQRGEGSQIQLQNPQLGFTGAVSKPQRDDCSSSFTAFSCPDFDPKRLGQVLS